MYISKSVVFCFTHVRDFCVCAFSAISPTSGDAAYPQAAIIILPAGGKMKR